MTRRPLPKPPPDRWVRALVASCAVTQARDLRFVGFSLGELARDVMLGPVGFVGNPVGWLATPEHEQLGRSRGRAPLARASRRSGIVGITTDGIVMVNARTGWSRPHGRAVRADLAEIRFVRACGTSVALTLLDDSVVCMCFARCEEAAPFLSL